MARTALAALALVVVVASSTPVAAGPDAGPPAADAATPSFATDGPPVANPGGPARMAIGPRELERDGAGTTGPDLGAAVRGSTVGFGSRLDGLATGYRFDATATVDGRRTVVDQALIALEDRSSALAAAQRTALRSYANDSIGARTLLLRLAAVHRTAEQLEPRLSRLGRLAEAADARYYETRITRIRGTLRTLQGPVRGRVAAAVAADEPLPRVTVEAAPSSVVLAYVDGGSYVRESYFLANRNTTVSRELDTLGEAADRARTYYPWSYDNQAGNSRIGGNIPAGIYSITVPHTKGELTAFLDAGTGLVFKEHQRLRLPALDPSVRAEASENGLRLVLNATYPGGPMRVELYDAATGERVRGRLELDGRSYTVPAGEPLWVVEPRGTYDATARHDGATVNVSVPPETVRSQTAPVG